MVATVSTSDAFDDKRRARIQESLMRAEEIRPLPSRPSAHREATERRAQDQVHRHITRSRAKATADADRIRKQATLRHGSRSVDSDLEDGRRSAGDLDHDV
jgi:hypothetical protein